MPATSTGAFDGDAKRHTVSTPRPFEVQLREAVDADLPILFEQQLDPEATRMAAFPSRDREPFTRHWRKIRADDSVVLRIIMHEEEVTGSIVSWEQSGMRLVGYWLGKRFWGRGLATAALRQFARIVEARPLYAYVAKHNLGSIRVLEKCGFTVCGEDTGFPEAEGKVVEEFLMKLESCGGDGS